MANGPYVVWLRERAGCDPELVGGKCANLGELIRDAMPVPPAFAIAIPAFQDHVTENGLGPQIRQTLSSVDSTADLETASAASDLIRQLVTAAPVPGRIAEAVADAYRRLCRECDQPEIRVAVRSSACVEDMPRATLAGQQESFLWVRGVPHLLDAMTRCWCSLFTSRAMLYRHRMGIYYRKLRIGVGIQQMVDARVAGIMFTLDPSNGDRSKIAIEASHGLGQRLVAGEVTPDRFLVDKVTLSVVRRTVSDEQAQTCLIEDEAVELSRLARRIEKKNLVPQDIEWAIARQGTLPGNIAILQSRPETAWVRRVPAPIIPPLSSALDYVVALVSPAAGLSASSRIAAPPRSRGDGRRATVAAYMMRHGEVRGHQADLELTAAGREQAWRGARFIAAHIAAGDTVFICYSPVRRARQTAELVAAGLAGEMAASGRASSVIICDPQPDEALFNGRFILTPGREPREPASAYADTTDTAILDGIPFERAEFFRGFWASQDPMGYWLTRDSAGAAEPPSLVLDRVRERLKGILASPARIAGRTSHWVLVTHSGTMRVVVREAFGEDPGEPEFGEILYLEDSAQSSLAKLTCRDRKAFFRVDNG
ncbi:MAG: PEP/pyruvate-binding domain-containing protein [Acidobacteriota bacterium]